MLFAGADHPMCQSATTDRHASAFEGLCQTIKRCPVGIFMNEREGQRRGRGNAAWQGLRGHRCDDNRRIGLGAIAVPTRVFCPCILQDLRLHLDIQLLGDALAHPMHTLATAPAELLVIRKIIFNALAWQVCRQRPAAALFTFRFLDGRQVRIRQIDEITVSSSATCSASLKMRSTCFSLRGAKRCSRASASSSSSLKTRCARISF